MLAADRWVTLYNLHPVTFFTLAYIAGIAIHAYDYTYYALLIITGFILCTALYRAYRIANLGLFLGCILFFIGGITRFFYEKRSYDELFSRSGHDRYTCTGRVQDITAYHHPYFKKRITVTTDQLLCTTDQTFVYTRRAYLLLYVPEYVRYTINDEIIISDITLKKPKSTTEAIRTMRSQIIACIFNAHPTYTVQRKPQHSIRHYLFEKRSEILSSVCAQLTTGTQSLYMSLFLGNKTDSPLPSKIVRSFSVWGISHHLARSGLHLIIFVWLWLLLLQIVPLPHTIKYIAIIFLGACYYLLSWPSISFDRAFLSFMLFTACLWHRTPLDSMHAISLVILFFLFSSPTYLFCLDFQLSFGLTYALAWFNYIHKK